MSNVSDERSDVVVIGSGPAGATMARRLAEGGRSVILVEAGPGGPRPQTVAGLDLVAASGELSRQWPGLTVRDRVDGPARAYRQGWGLGGASMINGMVLSLGDTTDYRRWEDEHRCRGWGPVEMDRWLRRALEDHRRLVATRGPVGRALADVVRADGVVDGGRSIDQDRAGVLDVHLAAHSTGVPRRWSSADISLGGDGPGGAGPSRPETWVVEGLPLTIRTGVAVGRIGAPRAGALTGTSTTTIELEAGATLQAPLVVVCAGAFGSAALLLRSGLAGRPVGAGLADHPSVVFTVEFDDGPGESEASPFERVPSTLIRWSSGFDECVDLHATVIERVETEGRRLAVVVVGIGVVASRGRVELAGRLGRQPAIVTGALTDPTDRHRLRVASRRVARWLAQMEAAGSVPVVSITLDHAGLSAAEMATLNDDDLDRILLASPGPNAHPAGTCRMGPDGDQAVVTSAEEGRLGALIGYDGVRLADSSIFPDLVQGGLQVPVAAVSERIAADILGRS